MQLYMPLQVSSVSHGHILYLFKNTLHAMFFIFFMLKCFTYKIYSGAGVVYVINEVEGTLEVSYKLSVSSKDYPGKFEL